MGSKIVSIIMTVFMLIMCVMTMTTLSMANMKKGQDHILDRAGSSVLSTDGEIKSDNSVTVRGSSLISSIVGINRIDNKIPVNGYKIYSYETEVGTYQSIYSFRFNGITSEDEIIAALDAETKYDLEYDFNKDSINVTIKRGS